MSSRKRARRKESEDDFDNEEDDDETDTSDAGAKWACQSCTFQNRFGAFRCHVCGSRKGTSTRKARLSENVVEMQKSINDLVIKQAEKSKAVKRTSKANAAPFFVEPSGSAPRTPAPADKTCALDKVKVEKAETPVSSPAPTLSPAVTNSPTLMTPEPKRFKKDVSPAVTPAKLQKETPQCVIGIAKPVDVPINKEQPPAEIIVPKAEVIIKEDDKKPVTVIKKPSPFSVMSLTSTEGPSSSTQSTSRLPASPHISPTTSRQSSETDSSSDSSNARSIEPPSNDRFPIRVQSTRIPDFMIHREIPKKIVVVANGIPAVFYEFPRKVRPTPQTGLPL